VKETINIAVDRYTTPEGQPTCSLNVDTGEVCRFIGGRNFGFTSVCMLSGNDVHRAGGNGFHVPEKSCPVWEVTL
jgi:hypothetical protein